MTITEEITWWKSYCLELYGRLCAKRCGLKKLKDLGWDVKVVASATINGHEYESVETDASKPMAEILSNLLAADKRIRK